MNTNLPPPLVTQMHEIEYKIHGDDMQFVEVELDPGEAVVAEAGGMMFMDDGIGGLSVSGVLHLTVHFIRGPLQRWNAGAY